MKKIVVDVSELEAPMPLVKTMQEVVKLNEGEYIMMIHRMEPCLLYGRLDANGYIYRTIKKGEGVEVFICHPQDEAEMLKEIVYV